MPLGLLKALELMQAMGWSRSNMGFLMVLLVGVNIYPPTQDGRPVVAARTDR